MSATASIRLSALRVALIARRGTGRAWCAYSRHPRTGTTCIDIRCGCEPRRGIGPSTPSPTDQGDLYALLRRVRRQHGPSEVRRTWGAGIRALTAEFGSVAHLQARPGDTYRCSGLLGRRGDRAMKAASLLLACLLIACALPACGGGDPEDDAGHVPSPTTPTRVASR
mgnify:CR=1 FL=1